MEVTAGLSTEELDIIAFRSQGLTEGEVAAKLAEIKREEAARREEAKLKVVMSLGMEARLQWLKKQEGIMEFLDNI